MRNHNHVIREVRYRLRAISQLDDQLGAGDIGFELALNLAEEHILQARKFILDQAA